MGRPSWQAWIDEYAQSHQHPVNRLCHTIGIPMIAASVALAPFSFLAPTWWRLPAGLFGVGWAFQFAGHAFERKPPEFLKDWRFLFVGLRWWVAKLQGRA
jgi:uncharacterized membrane protein YGL010W